MYNDYRITIQPSGSIGTPWQSDTIFGHMAWIVAFKGGEKAIREFLAPFIENDPPFILSDGFPGDYMPIPLLDKTYLESEFRSVEEYNLYKKVKKARFVELKNFCEAREKKKAYYSPVDEQFSTIEVLHASINRMTNSTGEEGQLFSTNESYLKEGKTLTIYVRCKNGWIKKVYELFKELSLTGFGRDKSTGIGAFNVKGFEKFDGFEGLDNANGFISISSFVPAENDPTEGRWRIRVKRGFLGEHAGKGNPFKRPLIQFEPGAVFKTETAPKPWYGRMVKKIAPGMPEAVQNCMTLAVPCII